MIATADGLNVTQKNQIRNDARTVPISRFFNYFCSYCSPSKKKKKNTHTHNHHPFQSKFKYSDAFRRGRRGAVDAVVEGVVHLELAQAERHLAHHVYVAHDAHDALHEGAQSEGRSTWRCA